MDTRAWIRVAERFSIQLFCRRIPTRRLIRTPSWCFATHQLQHIGVSHREVVHQTITLNLDTVRNCTYNADPKGRLYCVSDNAHCDAASRMLWYVRTPITLFQKASLYEIAPLPDGQTKSIKRLDQATRLASALVVFAIVCVTCDDKLSAQASVEAVTICHVSAQYPPYIPTFTLSLSSSQLVRYKSHGNTMLTCLLLCRIPFRHCMLRLS